LIAFYSRKTNLEKFCDIFSSFDEKVINFVSQEGYDPKFGARPIKRSIKKNIEDVLVDMLINGDFTEDDKILVTFTDNKINFIKQ
jgi:ATP-dependent Clp protease ATP-binding subunit ClpA